MNLDDDSIFNSIGINEPAEEPDEKLLNEIRKRFSSAVEFEAQNRQER